MSETQKPTFSRYRRPSWLWRAISLISTSVGIALALMYIFGIRPFGFVQPGLSYMYALLALFLPLCFVWIPAHGGAPKDRIPWYDVLLCIVAFAAPMYAAFHAMEIQVFGWTVTPPTEALVAALLLWPVLIEAGRRAAGVPFAVVVLVFSVYPLFAGFAPGPFLGANFSPTRTISYHIYSQESVMGIPVRVFGTLLIGYMVFATALQQSGVGKFFNHLAVHLVGTVRGGNAKIAIVSSSLVGMISGQSASNVFTTGVFTIPAMKRDGFLPEVAGGVEAVASTGGVLMPPVMGTVAFVMAAFIGVPYATVAAVAITPAFFYYFTLFLQIDAYAAKHGLTKTSAMMEGVPPLWQVLLNNAHIMVSFLLLVYLLFFYQLDTWAPWIATIVLLLLGAARRETRTSLRSVVSLVESVGRVLGNLMGIIAPVGMIVGAFVLTGLAFSLPYIIVSLAGNSIFLLLLGGAVASFILGMGVTGVACYIFLALTLAPALVKQGIDLIPAHFFILYCAIWSHITPPVSIAAFAAATIADSNPVKTGVQAMRLGITVFMLPFFFVTNPAMLMRGDPLNIVQSLSTAVLGFALVSAAIEGYLWKVGVIKMPTRIPLFLAGVLLAYPATMTDIWGAVVAAVVLAIALVLRQRGVAPRLSRAGGNPDKTG